jgi:hypothetical protein
MKLLEFAVKYKILTTDVSIDHEAEMDLLMICNNVKQSCLETLEFSLMISP